MSSHILRYVNSLSSFTLSVELLHIASGLQDVFAKIDLIYIFLTHVLQYLCERKEKK